MNPPYLTVDALLTTTRAVRRRLDLDRPVPDELVLEYLRLVMQAPSGGNRDPWHWIVVTDPQVRSELAGLYRRAFDDYQASNRFAGSCSPTTSTAGTWSGG